MDRDPPRIAIVDDDAAVRRSLMRLLRSANYRVQAFDSACSLLDSLSERLPQCLILDLRMPAMSGLELQQRLLQLNITIPVIVITAYDEPGTRERCFDLGARSYLIKPIAGNDLLEAVQLAVGRNGDAG